MATRVLIVGGGLAGLAAAAALAQHGVPCHLLESRNRLGGRASSFQDRKTGAFVDNCQHVAMGCCTNFRHFCETVGLDASFRREPTLFFYGPDGRCDRFCADPVPAPFHLARAFMGLGYLTWGDKYALSQGLKELASPRYQHDERPFSEWLAAHRQPPRVVQHFWLTVLVSALSESLDRIATRYARQVFVNGFLNHPEAWYVDIPVAPWDQLYESILRPWLAARDVLVEVNANVERVELLDGRVTGVSLRGGRFLPADEVILAAPFYRVLDLLPDELRDHPQVAPVGRLESAPISSVHFWLDRPITDHPHAVFVTGLCQWLFNRTQLEGTPVEGLPSEGTGHAEGAEPRYYYQVVISASREVLGRPQEEVIDEVARELAGYFPAMAGARRLHTRMVTEHRAVFSVTPGVDALRPPQQSPVENLQFAGDWTRTGWPATMEGAVRSGYLAAENLLARRHRPARLLQPDLPTATLSRWLFG